MLVLSALGFLVALCQPSGIEAQDAASAGPGLRSDSSRVGRVIRQLQPDDRLRLRLTGAGSTVEGRFMRAESGSLMLASGPQEVAVPYVEVERLWTRGRSTGQGAWIGALGGLVIGAVYGVAISEVTCAESSCTTLGVATAMAGLGAAGGAGLGALVGLAIPRWRQRFP